MQAICLQSGYPANTPSPLQAAAVSFANIMFYFEAQKQPELEGVQPPFNIFRITQGWGPQPNRGRILGGSKVIVRPEHIVTSDTHEIGVITPNTTVFYADAEEAVLLHYRRGRLSTSFLYNPTQRNVTDMLDFRYEQVKQSPYLSGLLQVLGYPPNHRL
jgi:hypothetical protein